MHDPRLHFRADGRGPPGARRVLAQRVDATLQKAAAPQGDRAPVEADFDSDLLVLPAFGGKQNKLRTLTKTRFNAALPRQSTQFLLRLRIESDRLRNSHRLPSKGRCEYGCDYKFPNFERTTLGFAL